MNTKPFTALFALGSALLLGSCDLVPPSSGGSRPPSYGPATPPLSSQVIGTWKGGRHTHQYRADGRFILDPYLPYQPIGRWYLSGRRMTEVVPGGVPMSFTIVSVNRREMVTRDDEGRSYVLRRED